MMYFQPDFYGVSNRIVVWEPRRDERIDVLTVCFNALTEDALRERSRLRLDRASFGFHAE